MKRIQLFILRGLPTLTIGGLVFLSAGNSWALGVPNFPALNNAFGILSLVFIGIAEFYLAVQLISHISLAHRGQPGHVEKIWIIVGSMLFVPLVPSIANYMYQAFFSTGAAPSQGVWNGQ